MADNAPEADDEVTSLDEEVTSSLQDDHVTSVQDGTSFSSIDTKKLVCIAFPGYINNVDNMLATMGGEEKISDTYYNTKCRLKMTYRPEDKNAHYACADLMPCTGLLMRVRRRKKKNGHTEGGEYEYKQDVVGVTKEQYKFNTPFDYQYLTPEPLWHHFDEIHGSELAQRDLPPYYAPPVFARIDTVGQYNYRPDPLIRATAANKRLQGEDDEDEPFKEATPHGRKKRQTESMAALFDTEQVPKEPSETAVSIIENLRLGGDAEAINTIHKMFEERPLWSKLAISCHVEVGFERFKKILQYCGYYWLSGPWRTMWCRIGYDPRKDPNAKMYQMLDFRIRDSKENRVDYSRLIPKRSAKNYVPRNLQSRLLSPTSSVMAASAVREGEREADPLPYIFSPHKMLPSRNCLYQLCDIEMEEVQNILHENDGQETICTEKDGWFPPGALQRIRKLMTDAINDLIRESSASGTTGTSQHESEAADGDDIMEDQSDCPMSENTGYGSGTSYQPYSYLQMLNDTEDLDGYTIYGAKKTS